MEKLEEFVMMDLLTMMLKLPVGSYITTQQYSVSDKDKPVMLKLSG
jgi:hypothetical protein